MVLALLIAAAGLLAAASAALATPPVQPAGDAEIRVVQNQAQVRFPTEIQFRLQAESPGTIAKVIFHYQVDDSRVVNQGTPAYSPGSSVTAIYAWRVDGVLWPGSQVRYQWVVETTGGQKLTTPYQEIVFNDTRFAWRELASGKVTLYTYVAERTASEGLLQQTADALGWLEREFGLVPDRPMRVFAYATQEHYLTAVAAGGSARPVVTIGSDRIFALATLSPPTLYPLLRREVAQAVFTQHTKNAYADPPRWLVEGFPLYVAPDDQLLSANNMQALRQLAQANRLLSLKSISGTFPTTQGEQALAYVESYSVVKYIVDQYGAAKLRALLQAIKDGNPPDDALKKALGITMEQLEGKWKEAVKSGRALRTVGEEGQPGAKPGGASAAPTGPLGRATQFWRGVFGEYTQWVLIGGAAVVGVSVVLLVLGSLLRRRPAEDEP